MQASDYFNMLSRSLKIIIVIVVSTMGMCWLYQQNLNLYWTLHFHRDAPWSAMTAGYWREGAKIMNAATLSEQAFISALQGDDEGQNPQVSMAEQSSTTPTVHDTGNNLSLPVSSQEPSGLLQLSRQVAITQYSGSQTFKAQAGATGKGFSDSIAESLYDNRDNQKHLAILGNDKKVLLIGDSMMEGVAPRVLKIIQDQHNATGINLSRRSTGLAYPGFFNWPVTTEKTLRQTPSVGLLVVFLGPNDPWDMPAGKGKPFLKFGSEDWEVAYRGRIDQILDLTTEYHIPVVWVMPPAMRKLKLSHGVKYLNTLYSAEVEKYGGILVDVNNVFDYGPDNYAPDILVRGKMTRVRADDGIHYTPAGENLIAKAIVSHIRFEQQEDLPTDEK
ncbi:SGNH/GDSL hydrolase family protein [Enterobacter sp. PTB]